MSDCLDRQSPRRKGHRPSHMIPDAFLVCGSRPILLARKRSPPTNRSESMHTARRCERACCRQFDRTRTALVHGRSALFAAEISSEASNVSQSLTPQQHKVLQLLGEGLLNKQIAYRLSVSEATVKAHVSAILQKLDASGRFQAVQHARRDGLLAGYEAVGAC